MSEGSAGKVNMAFIAAIVAVATIGGFMFGYDSGVINGTQKGLESAFDLGKLGIGVNVGAILVGSSIGAFGAGRMADIIGRRGVMMLSAVLFLLSALLAGAAGSSAGRGKRRAMRSGPTGTTESDCVASSTSSAARSATSRPGVSATTRG